MTELVEGMSVQVRRSSGPRKVGTVSGWTTKGRVRVVFGDGTERHFDASDVSPSAIAITVRRALPETSDEAESWEAAAKERSAGTVRAPMRAVPKDGRSWTSRPHLEAVRAGGCCVCGSMVGIHAHHLENAGRGRKCSDALAVPLCGEHHGQWHARGFFDDGDTQDAWRLMWETVARILAARLEEMSDDQT